MYSKNIDQELCRGQNLVSYIHTYIFFKPIILTQEPQKHRKSSKSLIRKNSPLQSFLFKKAKNEFRETDSRSIFTKRILNL